MTDRETRVPLDPGTLAAVLAEAALLEAKDPAEHPALGRDPFEASVDFDPFEHGLAVLGFEGLRPATAGSKDESAPREGDAEPLTAPERRAWTTLPRLSEIEPVDPTSVVERWLGPEERRRLAALHHLVESELAYDRFGLSPDVLRRAFPFFYALYRLYFRVQSRGHENLPEQGPAILASNHGGLLPFDGAMLIVDMLLHTDPPRLARSVVDRWAGNLPWVSIFYARVGQVIGTRENVADLLADGQLVLVFPEGVAGIRKNVTQRNRLQAFHVGFVEEALRSGAPIVPTAVVGSDDQAPILHDFQGLARRLGLPALPITPTFPWLGPLGLLPYPVGYRIVYGEPLDFSQRFGPESAEDPRLVRYLAGQVRHRCQQLLDREA